MKESEVPGVWEIVLPRWPWVFKNAQKDRAALLRSLIDKYSYCFLWVRDPADDKAEAYHSLGGTDLLLRLEQLDEGGWALLFFEAAPAPPPQGLEYWPPKPLKARECLDSSEACAAIFSWEDDIEWIVAIRSPAVRLIKPPIIVNENRSMGETGDVSVFKSVAALESYIEPWYVDESHFIFDSEELKLEIAPNGHNVRLAPTDPLVSNPEIARLYFAAFLKWQKGPEADAKFLEAATLLELAAASREFADG